MVIEIDSTQQDRKDAKLAHELFTINVILIHLFGTLSFIKLFNISMAISIGMTIFISMSIVIYTYLRTKKAKQNDSYLVYLHWQLSLNRYKILITAYGFYLIIISLGLFIDDGNVTSMDGSSITHSLLTLLGTVPLFFAVLITAVLGSGSMFNAGRGEIDKSFMEKYPT
jgi:hypothetical protein